MRVKLPSANWKHNSMKIQFTPITMHLYQHRDFQMLSKHDPVIFNWHVLDITQPAAFAIRDWQTTAKRGLTNCNEWHMKAAFGKTNLHGKKDRAETMENIIGVSMMTNDQQNISHHNYHIPQTLKKTTWPWEIHWNLMALQQGESCCQADLKSWSSLTRKKGCVCVPERVHE